MITQTDKEKIKFGKMVKLLDSTSQTQLGFTLIESIVAMVVVGALLTAIAPLLALTVAARVQARRVDLATQASRAYTEGVRGGTIAVVDFPATLRPPVTATTAPYFNEVPAPNASGGIAFSFNADCSNANFPGICVDTNNNGFSVNDPQDLVIQPMRTGGNDIEILQREGFDLGVRVYRADAFSGLVTTFYKGSEAQCDASKQTFISTTGSRQCPLVIMSAEIFPTVSGDNFDQIRGRIPVKR
jgi:prepilin-type N-terminal cleavage/methylation domain-containing protein